MKKGYIVVDCKDRSGKNENVTMFSIGGEREVVQEALSLIIGIFPIYCEGVIYCPSKKEEDQVINEEITRKASDNECRVSSFPEFVVDYIDRVNQSRDDFNVEEDDIFYDAKEGCYDIDTSHPEAWSICEFQVPESYSFDNRKNLKFALENTCQQFNLLYLEQ